MWGATRRRSAHRTWCTDFNPRSPCGERHGLQDALCRQPNFNPRSPCGERQGGDIFSTTLCKFQSPLPVWGATATTLVNAPCGVSISIPAPRVGSDIKPQFPQTIGFFISIPAPRVGSDSTPAEICRGFPISIPAPRVGSDFHFHGFLSGDGLFQSPLPVWGATTINVTHT